LNGARISATTPFLMGIFPAIELDKMVFTDRNAFVAHGVCQKTKRLASGTAAISFGMLANLMIGSLRRPAEN